MSEVVYDRDAQGIVTLLWEAPGQPVNMLDDRSFGAFDAAVSRVLADGEAVGAIVASAKRDFIVGSDLKPVLRGEFERLSASVASFHAVTRRMELGGKPFAAALGGSALGAGSEIALACHRRFAASDVDARFACADVTLGLVPGGGGTQRIPRLAGIVAALPLLVDGKSLTFAEAAQLGLIDELVPAADLLDAARAWLLANRRAKAPWDEKGFAYPGGMPQSPRIADAFASAAARLRKRTWGNEPATRDVLSAVYEGTQLAIDDALRVEARYFRKALARPQARAMVKTLCFSLSAAREGRARPFSSVGVVGAGMMGAGIAHVAARAGAHVVLVDRDATIAGRAAARGAALGASTETLARIHPTADYADLQGTELVIEAVFEDRAVKAETIRRIEASAPGATLGTNTSTLPIGSLADTSARPERFVGLHFFSPVERMQLVEIVRGAATGDGAVSLALDFVRFLGKIPIVVNDGRGFFTSRVFATYVHEGLAMLREGVPPALIENAGRLAGMAVGPLAVADEIGFTLLWSVVRQTRLDLGSNYVPGPADDVIEAFATTLDRPGKAAGRGAYAYPESGKKELWAGLSSRVARGAARLPVDVVRRRLLYAQVSEALRCRKDGVIEDPAMGDLGSILGWGFPAFTGGVFSFVEYTGAATFERERARLEAAYGERFGLPEAAIAVAG